MTFSQWLKEKFNMTLYEFYEMSDDMQIKFENEYKRFINLYKIKCKKYGNVVSEKLKKILLNETFNEINSIDIINERGMKNDIKFFNSSDI